MKWVKYIFVIAGLAVAVNMTLAQVNDSARVKTIGFSGQYGFIFAHSRSVQNTAGANPVALQMEAGRQRLDTTVWDLCHCFPQQGWLLNYTNYDVGVLGHGLTGAYYLQPSFFLTPAIQFGIRGVTGVSWSSHPFDSLHNPSNQSYSTALNAYVSLGLHTSFRISRCWQLNGFMQYNHISNGGLKNPNKGINWPTAGLGFTYTLGPIHRPDFGARSRARHKKRWRVDAAAFYSSRVIVPGETRRYPIYGISGQVSRTAGQLHAWTAGVEFTLDKALAGRMQKAHLSGIRERLAGVATGHEFLLGRFVFGQQLGIYIVPYGPYYNLVYHRWALWYRMNKHLGLGGSLKVHGHVANLVDIRLVYSINP